MVCVGHEYINLTGAHNNYNAVKHMRLLFEWRQERRKGVKIQSMTTTHAWWQEVSAMKRQTHFGAYNYYAHF